MQKAWHVSMIIFIWCVFIIINQITSCLVIIMFGCFYGHFFFLLLGVLMFVSMILYVILSMTTRPFKKSLYMFLGHKFCMGDHYECIIQIFINLCLFTMLFNKMIQTHGSRARSIVWICSQCQHKYVGTNQMWKLCECSSW
jgi:hypothetical protein